MIDWMRLLRDLRGLHGTLTNVDRLINRHNPAMLTRLERGDVKDPSYSLGSSLIDLYQKNFDCDLPRVGAMQQKRLV